jgi:putative endopeptidase
MAKENFYNYVTADVDLKILPGDSQATFMLELQAKIDKKLWKAERKKDSPFLQTLHAPWRRVRDVLQLDPVSTVQKVIQRILRLNNSSEIPKLLKLLHEYGVHPLFQMQYDPDLEHPKREIIYLRINDPSFSDDKSHVKYTNMLFEAFQVRHPNFTPHQLEIDINRHRPPRHDLQSAELCFNPLDAENLKPHLKWLVSYFDPMSVQRFSVDSLKYFESIGEALINVSVERWQAYLMFHWLNHVSSFFLDTYDLFFRIERAHMSDIKMGARKGYIMDMANTAWWQDAGYQFIETDRDYLEKCRHKIRIMAESVRAALRKMFAKSSWELSTKREALQKLRKMEFIIGWSDVDFGEFPRVTEDMYFDEAILLGWKYQYHMISQHQDAKTNRKAWRCTGYNEVNAFYSRELNCLFLPASVFYPPFFTLSPEKTSENFGAMGSIIAHEIYHGFDYDSRMVDSRGMLKNWWSRVDNKNFLKNAQKTITLYSEKRSISGSHKINGRLTLSENIADIIALQMAWNAFCMWRQSQRSEGFRKEDEIQQAKKFFHMFALSQTQIYSKHALEMSLKIDYHAVSMARVNIPLSIFPAFLEIYDVKRGDPMFTIMKKRPNFIPQSDDFFCK